MNHVINVEPGDLYVLAFAARRLQEAGHERESVIMDKLARKANASSQNRDKGLRGSRGAPKPLTWRDVPSTLAREPRL